MRINIVFVSIVLVVISLALIITSIFAAMLFFGVPLLDDGVSYKVHWLVGLFTIVNFAIVVMSLWVVLISPGRFKKVWQRATPFEGNFTLIRKEDFDSFDYYAIPDVATQKHLAQSDKAQIRIMWGTSEKIRKMSI